MPTPGERPSDERSFLLKSAIHEVLNEREHGARDANGNGSVAIGYGKWWARFKGERLIAVLTILLALGFVSYLLYRHDEESRAAQKKTEAALSESNDIQQAILWVNSLSDGERSKLNLAMPPKIREMQRRREQ